MSDLLPCPFCGGKAESIEIDAEHGDTNFGGSVIQCSRCFASSHVEFGFKENLVSAWNSRAPDARKATLEDAARVAEKLPSGNFGGLRIDAAIRALKEE